ncbi:MAG: hypothetical protein IK065_02200 [Neisseriaceae bacterium]|nr:hypothetical protein [Neisseriaceae bacterium]
MFLNRFVYSIALCTLLASCGKPESSVSDADINKEIASAEEANFSSMQTLTDSSQKITLKVNGMFTVDEIDSSNSSLTLLSRNQLDDALIRVEHLGKLQVPSEQYFKQLASMFKQQKTYNDVRIGNVVDERMSYRFTYKVDEDKFKESCLAIVDGEELYSVCVQSVNLSFDAMDKYLSDVRVN